MILSLDPDLLIHVLCAIYHDRNNGWENLDLSNEDCNLRWDTLKQYLKVGAFNLGRTCHTMLKLFKSPMMSRLWDTIAQYHDSNLYHFKRTLGLTSRDIVAPLLRFDLNNNEVRYLIILSSTRSEDYFLCPCINNIYKRFSGRGLTSDGDTYDVLMKKNQFEFHSPIRNIDGNKKDWLIHVYAQMMNITVCLAEGIRADKTNNCRDAEGRFDDSVDDCYNTDSICIPIKARVHYYGIDPTMCRVSLYFRVYGDDDYDYGEETPETTLFNRMRTAIW